MAWRTMPEQDWRDLLVKRHRVRLGCAGKDAPNRNGRHRKKDPAKAGWKKQTHGRDRKVQPTGA